MNASKQGMNAGVATRKVINTGARTTRDASITVGTAVTGFFKGLFSDVTVETAKPARRQRAK